MFASLSRRKFLAVSSVACAARFNDPQILSAADDKDGWGGFPVGVQTISLRKYSLPEAMRHLVGMSVSNVEISASSHMRTTVSDEAISEIRQLAARVGMKLTAHGVNRFSKDHAANERVFVFAKKLGIRTITANPDSDAETFASLDKLVAKYDLRIAIHNHGPGSQYDKLESVVQTIQNHDSRIGACVDCGHFLSSGEDPVHCILTLGERVHGVHLKDHAEIGKKSESVVLGKGHLDVVSLFKALRHIKFPPDGALSLEYEANRDNPIDDLNTCLVVVKEAIAKSF